MVSKPTRGFGSVVQWDYGQITMQGHFNKTGMLNNPPSILLTAMARLQAELERSQISDIISATAKLLENPPRVRVQFTYCGQEQDRLLILHMTIISPKICSRALVMIVTQAD